MKIHHNKYIRATLMALLLSVSNHRVEAQTHTVLFSLTDPGATYSITNWGLDTCWPNSDNMQRGLIYMGTNNVTIVRVGFTVDSPLTNNDVSPADKSTLQTCMNLASMATAATRWDLNLDSGVNSWYESGANVVYPDRWAAAMEACQRYYNRNFWAAEGFNEPDYTPNGEGTPQNLYDIFGYLQSSTNFPGTLMEGGSTLNDDVALTTWFDVISPRATIGSTHCLAGSATSYATFLQSVTSSNALAFNPELHNVMEAIMGVNYGLQGGIWWGTAERARGAFVNACQGKRLAYADDLNNWTAAAVYRGNDGAVQAFFGGSERMAITTTYWLFSKDRPVFYDGYGPTHDYVVTVPGGTGYQQNQSDAEKVVDITWGSDAPPAINGRYLIVNRNSGQVLEVPGGSSANGTFLDQNTYSGQLYQQWNVNPLPSTFGGDYSYFTLNAAHDGVTADLYGWSYSDGGQIDQWNGGTNVLEQWILQYAGNGYFKIRNRWDNKVMGVMGGSTNTGAAIVQWDDTGSLDQQWRLIPATVSSYHLTGAPAAPTGLAATANAVSVQLNWNTNTESDLAGYTVLRATNSGGPYDIIARGLTTNLFTDGYANETRSYYYVVAANDTSLNQSSYSSEVSATPTLSQTMVAHYTFDNTNTDGSGNGNDAELIGAPGYASGKLGSSVALNGAGQSVVVPADIVNTCSNFTIAAWVYWNGGNAWQRIFDFGNNTTQYMFLTPGSGNGTLRFAVTTNGPGAEQQLNTSPMPSLQWFHVAVTYNGTTASLYTNGVLAASGTITIPPTAFNPVANFLGQSQWPADPTLNGDLDDFYIFNYALTAAQIVNLSSGIPPGNGPAAPTGLSATGGNLVVNLNWTQSTGSGITGNNVYRSTSGSGGPYNLLANLGATTSYSDTAVNPGSTYFYSVTAVNSGGESGLSAYAGATTIPAAPTGLTSTPGSNQVSLTWAASTSAISYNVKRATVSGGPYTNIATGLTATNYTDHAAVNDTTYYYVVTAVNGSGESGNSLQVSAVPMKGLYGYWKFDETSGATAHDSISTNNGTVASAASWVPGHIGGAVSLNGTTNSYVSYPTGFVSKLTNFTVAGWVYLNSASTWSRIFDYGTSSSVYMFLTPMSSSSAIRFAITTSGNTQEQQINGTSVPSTGAWHHVAVTLSNKIGVLYVDGSAVGTNSNMTLNPSSLGKTTGNYIGRSQFSADPYLNGDVDDFRIYNRGLTAAEVSALSKQ